MKNLLFIAIIALLCVGCKVQNTKTTTNDKQSHQGKNTTQLQTYTAGISGSYTSIPFNGTLRLQRDSVLWVSVTGFGIEVARLLLTQDSVFAINKLEKEVFIGNYSDFEGHFGIPLSFTIAQKALMDTTDSHFQSQNQTDIIFKPQGKIIIEDFIFPKQINVSVKTHNSNTELSIKFSNQRINVPISTPFTIPPSYDIIK